MNSQKINELLKERQMLYLEYDALERPFEPSPLSAGGYEIFKHKNERKKTKQELIDAIKVNTLKTELEASMTAIEFANIIKNVLERNGYKGYEIKYINLYNNPRRLMSIEEAGKKEDMTACMVLTTIEDFSCLPDDLKLDDVIIISGRRFADSRKEGTKENLRKQKITIFEPMNRVAKYMDSFVKPFRLGEDCGADKYHSNGFFHGIANGVRHNMGINFLYAFKPESIDTM